VARVFVDTNVLFPYSVMDLMLALTEDGIHEIIWTDHLLHEWEHVIVRKHRRTPEGAARMTAAIREFFAEGEVPASAYADLVDRMPSKDPDDRRHIAAAVAGRASAIITWNRSDFPAGPIGKLGIRVLDPDVYLLELLADIPDEVVATVERVAYERRQTSQVLVDRLARAGVVKFATEIREQLAHHSEPTASEHRRNEERSECGGEP
jgi:predicted nucleic acid-binding protein